MKNGDFNLDDLYLHNCQYTITHTSPQDFKCGESVFLRSNPERPMTVLSINPRGVIVKWMSNCNIITTALLPPQCLLQYKYAGLVTYRRRIPISLN